MRAFLPAKWSDRNVLSVLLLLRLEILQCFLEEVFNDFQAVATEVSMLGPFVDMQG
jgi:hypothetical protein